MDGDAEARTRTANHIAAAAIATTTATAATAATTAATATTRPQVRALSRPRAVASQRQRVQPTGRARRADDTEPTHARRPSTAQPTSQLASRPTGITSATTCRRRRVASERRPNKSELDVREGRRSTREHIFRTLRRPSALISRCGRAVALVAAAMAAATSVDGCGLSRAGHEVQVFWQHRRAQTTSRGVEAAVSLDVDGIEMTRSRVVGSPFASTVAVVVVSSCRRRASICESVWSDGCSC